jgi:hypothetical protein
MTVSLSKAGRLPPLGRQANITDSAKIDRLPGAPCGKIISSYYVYLKVSPMRIYGRNRFTWRPQHDSHALHCESMRDALFRVVPDGTYAGMWRVLSRDGKLSDIVNLTRAKAAAVSAAMSVLNTQERAAEAPPMRPSAKPTKQHTALQTAL